MKNTYILLDSLNGRIYGKIQSYTTIKVQIMDCVVITVENTTHLTDYHGLIRAIT